MQRYVRFAYWVWFSSVIVGGVCAIAGVALDLRASHPGILGPIFATVVAICGLALVASTFFILAFEPVSPRRGRDR